ncbi:MAG: hypothetical protein ABR584_12435 [Candidatus Baltobacteraceae bacterium]
MPFRATIDVCSERANLRWFLLGSVLTGLRWLRGGRKAAAHGFSYSRNASVKILVYAMPFFLLPDQIVWMLFIPPEYFYLRPLFIVGDIYAMLAIAGIIATFDEFPHSIDGDIVTLRQGILKCARLDRHSVLATDVIGTQFEKSTIKARGGKQAAYFLTSGAPTVKLVLRTPVSIESIGGKSKFAEVIFVSVDEPQLFLAALKTVP